MSRYSLEVDPLSNRLPRPHAEYMLAEEGKIHLLPDGLGFEQAAPLLCAGYTVWSGLREANPLPADRVAVVGIGGLGHLAIQYAKAAGHTVVAVTRSAKRPGIPG